MNIGTRKTVTKSHYFALSFCVASLFALSFLTIAFYLTSKHGSILEQQKEPRKQHLPPRNEDRKASKEEGTAAKNAVLSCDLFSGKWVFDNASYPLYKEGQCSFMLNSYTDFACEKYGRKDVKYQKWRWQPHNCDLPRFWILTTIFSNYVARGRGRRNANILKFLKSFIQITFPWTWFNGTELLERIRGKRVVFVGDSLGRNQWTSMICLIESSLRQSSQKSFTRDGNLFIFHATEYNATIEYYWSPFFVESNCDDPFNHSIKVERAIKISAIEKHATRWTDADILIFDAYMWWRDPTMTLLWGGSFGSPDAIHKRVEMKQRRYEMALNTLSDWLEFNVNRTKTRIVFISQTPVHVYESWNTHQHCYNETEPVLEERFWRSTVDQGMMRVAESAIQKMEERGLKIKYFNITSLSDNRKDGHPSIYKNFIHPLSKEKLASPKSYADCVHWCLPGVPDVWNELLYAYIINNSS